MRVSIKDLEGIVSVINRLAGAPGEPYVKGEDGRYLPQAGCYHLDHAYGGVRLVRMAREGSGTHDVTGRHSRAVLYHVLHAFKDGLLADRAGVDRA